MPFKSEKQRRFMFSQHPDIAKRFVADARAAGKPIVDPKGAADPQTQSMIDHLKHRKAKKRSA